MHNSKPTRPGGLTDLESLGVIPSPNARNVQKTGSGGFKLYTSTQHMDVNILGVRNAAALDEIQCSMVHYLQESADAPIRMVLLMV
jgi:hypothetical protein